MVADFELHVKGKQVAMNEFVSTVIHNVVVTLLNTLDGIDIDKLEKVEVT